MNCHLSLLLLVGASQALPAADPQLGLPLFGGPVLYHAPNCTTEEDTITTKSCKPVTENECEDVEIPGSKIEYVDNCRVSSEDQYISTGTILERHCPAVWSQAGRGDRRG